MRIACIDIGTNTALLLIADIGTDRIIDVLEDRQEIVRLGRGVDRNGFISEDAFLRCERALHSYADVIRPYHPDHTVVTGTSAVRDAANRDEFRHFISERTGLSLEVLSGDEEARWTYAGAISGFPAQSDNVAVLDIGGGSTELTLGSGNTILAHQSVDIGAVRMTEQYLHHSPPDERDIRDMMQFLACRIGDFPDIDAGSSDLVAVAGTVTTLAAIELGLTTYDRHAVAGYRLSREQIEGRFRQFSSMTHDELTRQLAVDPGRADIIFAGVAILSTVMDRYGWRESTVSERGLRYGIAMREYLQRTDRPSIS